MVRRQPSAMNAAPIRFSPWAELGEDVLRIGIHAPRGHGFRRGAHARQCRVFDRPECRWPDCLSPRTRPAWKGPLPLPRRQLTTADVGRGWPNGCRAGTPHRRAPAGTPREGSAARRPTRPCMTTEGPRLEPVKFASLNEVLVGVGRSRCGPVGHFAELDCSQTRNSRTPADGSCGAMARMSSRKG